MGRKWNRQICLTIVMGEDYSSVSFPSELTKIQCLICLMSNLNVGEIKTGLPISMGWKRLCKHISVSNIEPLHVWICANHRAALCACMDAGVQIKPLHICLEYAEVWQQISPAVGSGASGCEATPMEQHPASCAFFQCNTLLPMLWNMNLHLCAECYLYAGASVLHDDKGGAVVLWFCTLFWQGPPSVPLQHTADSKGQWSSEPFLSVFLLVNSSSSFWLLVNEEPKY